VNCHDDDSRFVRINWKSSVCCFDNSASLSQATYAPAGKLISILFAASAVQLKRLDQILTRENTSNTACRELAESSCGQRSIAVGISL
jgi:DUF1680 family protein